MAKRIRIECEQRNRFGGRLIDQYTGQPAFLHLGEDVIFELGVFVNGRMLNRTEITVMDIELFTLAGDPITTLHLETSNMSSNVTAAGWRNGNAALARLLINSGNTITLPAGFFIFQVKATFEGLSSIVASGQIEGVQLATLVPVPWDPPNPAEYYTKDEVDAAFDPAGSGAAGLDLAEDIRDYLNFTPGDDPAKLVLFEAQSLTAEEKQVARENLGAAVAGGALTIIGESSGTGNTNAIPDGSRASVITVTPSGNTVIELRAPVLSVGQRALLRIQQGFQVKWTSDYTHPANAITRGASSGGFAKVSWHPDLNEGYDVFELLNDGATTHVSRFRQPAVPVAAPDWAHIDPQVTSSGGVYTGIYDLHGHANSSVIGAPGPTTMAGSAFPAFGYDGVDDATGWTCDAFTAAAGLSIAMVFTATATTGQKILFYSTAYGIQIVADSDGIRLQAKDAASGTGLLIATSYSAAPVAFVVVIRAGAAGAFVLTTDVGGGGQTGSFTPAAGASGACTLGGVSGQTRYLACKIARCQVWQLALSGDQARAALDALTEHYKLG
jgi:hypothetical protein